MIYIDNISRITGIYKVTANCDVSFNSRNYSHGDILYSFGVLQKDAEESEYRIILVDIKNDDWFETQLKYVKNFFNYIKYEHITPEERVQLSTFIKQNKILTETIC